MLQRCWKCSYASSMRTAGTVEVKLRDQLEEKNGDKIYENRQYQARGGCCSRSMF